MRLSLGGLLGLKFLPILPPNIIDRPPQKINITERELSWRLITSASELKDSMVRQRKLLELGKDIAWSFGFKIPEGIIKQKLKAEGRWRE